MPPPPAQAGKFKPRKPVKKIRPGEASSAAPDAATSSSTPTVAFAPSTDNKASRSERDSGGRDGGGRGGRGGRGRGRTPIPSGRVFFTAGEKLSASAKRKAATDKAGGLIRPKGKDQEATEEVVGQLETAIGSSKGPGMGGLANSMDYTEEYQQSQFDQAEKGSFAMEGFMYDSDSSREEERARGKSKEFSTIQPIELPFPSEPLPLGIGSSVRPVAYESSNALPDPVPSEQGVTTTNQNAAEPSLCPFVDPKDKEKLSWEQNSWFLVQLPTRLPPLQPKITDGPMPAYSAEDPIDDINVEDPNQLSAISDLVTPPITAKSHDNVLASAAPGRIGRILVYKSGKTVLKLEGPDGSSSILMNVNEGLSCSFLQQAVIIDPEEAKYVTLGNVTRSIVVTPDLEAALVAE